ncbi:ABC transporter ATP-binding protein [Ramlibacter sp.]|uniref:ABC transporter ATP-binding protein n=1 Tax=Ramlibacter sp. TaxID=1917967 RepID=UPI003D133A65
MLRLEGISAGYGNIQALRDVSLEVARGRMVALVGPNGAGKSTLFKVISGVVPARAGRIFYEGQDLLALDPADRAGLGIAHVPEGRQVFRTMTIAENLEMGAYCVRGRAAKKRAVERAYEIFPALAQRQRQQAGTLSGGQQQMLAIGRALASMPRLLLLDEPSLGLSPIMADEMFEHIGRAHTVAGVTVLLVEQRVAESLESCDWGCVLDFGRITLQGPPQTLLRDERIRATYMGIAAVPQDDAA